MNRILVAAFSLLAACSLTLGQNKESKNAGGNSLEQRIINISRETWEAYTTGNIAGIKAYTAEDFVAYSMSGPSNLQQDIANISAKKLVVESYAMDDPKVTLATKDVAILRYKSDLKGSYEGKPFKHLVHVTEVWVNRGGKWQIVSYSETPVRQ